MIFPEGRVVVPHSFRSRDGVVVVPLPPLWGCRLHTVFLHCTPHRRSSSTGSVQG